jgi:hypothetical protein
MLSRWTARALPIPAALCVPVLICAAPLIFFPASVYFPAPIFLPALIFFPPPVCVPRRRALLCLRIGRHRRGRGAPANKYRCQERTHYDRSFHFDSPRDVARGKSLSPHTIAPR